MKVEEELKFEFKSESESEKKVGFTIISLKIFRKILLMRTTYFYSKRNKKI